MLDAFETYQLPTYEFELETAFEDFKRTESLLWTGAEARDFRLMIKHSGSLHANIAIHLHFPTEKTRKIYDGEIADTSNGCTNMILVAGFTAEKSFWWDTHPWREDSRFEQSKHYSKAVMKSHRNREFTLRAHLHAKVVLVFGKPNQAAVLAQFRNVLEELVLWDENQTSLYIQFFSISKQFITRILVFVNHPMYYFYNIVQSVGRKMDEKLKIAAQLARVTRTEKEEVYFEWRALDRMQRKADRAANGTEFP
jgi:hypothetical protein